LCSDLAIRSGTAIKLGPEHYDRTTGLLTFRTKYQNAQRLSVTAELRALLDTCTVEGKPFVAQLPRGMHWRRDKPLPPLPRKTISVDALYSAFARVKKRVGITRQLTPHDLRRTTARRIYDMNHDLRVVQAVLGHSNMKSTLWYLQDNLVEIPVAAFELAKLNPITERPQ
jgi:integrase